MDLRHKDKLSGEEVDFNLYSFNSSDIIKYLVGSIVFWFWQESKLG